MNDQLTTTQLLPHEAERNPIVIERDDGVFANSRDVAAFFGKEVKHVHEAIRNLIEKEPSLGRANFRPFNIKDLTGISTAYYEMDRDGFSLLAMGFTGTKALKWKLRYIEAFNIMEADLRKRANALVIDMNDPVQLRGLLLNYAEKAQELEQRVDELLPSKAALDRISEADGSLCVTDAAKALQMRPADLFGYLRREKWIYRRAGTAHDIGFQSKVGQGLLEHKVTTVTRPDGSEKVTEQVRICPKGLVKLAELVGTAVH
jgi:Rha family phage regulatory protein